MSPYAVFILTPFIPALCIFSIIFLEKLAGPTVHKILVRFTNRHLSQLSLVRSKLKLSKGKNNAHEKNF